MSTHNLRTFDSHPNGFQISEIKKKSLSKTQFAVEFDWDLSEMKEAEKKKLDNCYRN